MILKLVSPPGLKSLAPLSLAAFTSSAPPTQFPFAAIVAASGRRPSTTAPCEAGTIRIAQAVSAGKPMITPSTTSANPPSCARAGLALRVKNSTGAAKQAATKERPSPTRIGSREATARRVAGKVRLKPRTPRRPKVMPPTLGDADKTGENDLIEGWRSRVRSRAQPLPHCLVLRSYSLR